LAIQSWSCRHEAFHAALKEGKGAFDDRAERSLAIRAVGYTYETEKVFYNSKTGEIVRATAREHVPPDIAAVSLWLMNRRRDEWKPRQVEDGNRPLEIIIRGGLSAAGASSTLTQTSGLLEESVSDVTNKTEGDPPVSNG
jgi:hypothetical protein